MNGKHNIKYIDPMVDFGFKRIFKDSGKKQLIIRPLNAIFGLVLSSFAGSDRRISMILWNTKAMST